MLVPFYNRGSNDTHSQPYKLAERISHDPTDSWQTGAKTKTKMKWNNVNCIQTILSCMFRPVHRAPGTSSACWWCWQATPGTKQGRNDPDRLRCTRSILKLKGKRSNISNVRASACVSSSLVRISFSWRMEDMIPQPSSRRRPEMSFELSSTKLGVFHTCSQSWLCPNPCHPQPGSQ